MRRVVFIYDAELADLLTPPPIHELHCGLNVVIAHYLKDHFRLAIISKILYAAQSAKLKAAVKEDISAWAQAYQAYLNDNGSVTEFGQVCVVGHDN